MSTGFAFRNERKSITFREMLAKFGNFERNPEGSFKASGTTVHTTTEILDKPL